LHRHGEAPIAPASDRSSHPTIVRPLAPTSKPLRTDKRQTHRTDYRQ